jgi:drug/metabolite transporter (DMT)-like permease
MLGCHSLLFAAPLVVLLCSPYLVDRDWKSVGTGAWMAIAYSAVLGTSFAAWQRGISCVGANRMLVYRYLITLTGVVSGVIFFAEHL